MRPTKWKSIDSEVNHQPLESTARLSAKMIFNLSGIAFPELRSFSSSNADTNDRRIAQWMM
jgi:hypothetical protein